MDISRNTRQFSIVAAVCFLLVATYNIYNIISWGDLNLNIVLVYSYGIVFAVFLFIGKKNIVLPIASLIYALFFFYRLTQYFTIQLAFLPIGFLGLFIVGMAERKNIKILKVIWFIPAAIILLRYLLIWIPNEYFQDISYMWDFILIGLIEVAGFLFMGLWLNGELVKNVASDYESNEDTSFNYQKSDSNSSLLDSADEIKMYKELLDDGAITQEEFNEKKKQILGL